MNSIPAAQSWWYNFHFHLQNKCSSVILPGSPGSSPSPTLLWQAGSDRSQNGRQEQNDTCVFHKLLLLLTFKKWIDEVHYIFPPYNFSKPKKLWCMIFFSTSLFRASYSLTFITDWRNTKFSIKSSIYPSVVLYSTSEWVREFHPKRWTSLLTCQV